MQKKFIDCKIELKGNCYTWLVTGGAGFIGSHLVEFLLTHNQNVIVIDNLSTGFLKNLELVKKNLTEKGLKSNCDKLIFLQEDINDLEVLQKKTPQHIDFILHQAALGSVPFSISNPEKTHRANVDGHFSILQLAMNKKVRSIVYASSSSVYGDNPDLPKLEMNIGSPLSPYALSKSINEQYSFIFKNTYQLNVIGIRYFNVFGPRQNPHGPYAAVIPKWIEALDKNQDVEIYGDGETSRDFCYVENVVMINILAAFNSSMFNSQAEKNFELVFNCANGEKTTLNELYYFLRDEVNKLKNQHNNTNPTYKEFRRGDIRHSLANIDRARKLLGYDPSCSVKMGVQKTVEWFLLRKE